MTSLCYYLFMIVIISIRIQNFGFDEITWLMLHEDERDFEQRSRWIIQNSKL